MPSIFGALEYYGNSLNKGLKGLEKGSKGATQAAGKAAEGMAGGTFLPNSLSKESGDAGQPKAGFFGMFVFLTILMLIIVPSMTMRPLTQKKEQYVVALMTFFAIMCMLAVQNVMLYQAAQYNSQNGAILNFSMVWVFIIMLTAYYLP
jgi:hypothetical protein